MIFNSIRWRLQAWHGLILVVVLTGFGLTAYHVARDNQLRRIDQELEQRLMALFRPPAPEHPSERPPEHGPDESRRGRHFEFPDFTQRIRDTIQQAGSLDPSQTNNFYYLLWQKDGSIMARSAGAPPNVPAPAVPFSAPVTPNPQPGPGNDLSDKPNRPIPPMPPVLRIRGAQRELCRFLPHGECALVGHSMVPDLAAMHRFALWLGAAGGGVLLLGLVGGWWVATRAIRPIDDISATAMKIAAGDLSQRIDASDTESELGRLAGVLNSTFARLEASFAHQARFTADASHELRTPVSVVLAQTQSALARERPAAEYRETLEACQRAAHRMRQLIESLLELARLDAGQQPMKREPFDLARVTQECIELVRPLALERRIIFHCELAPAGCVGDPERLGQVATNLLTNAIHFNRDAGEVRVSVYSENGAVFLRVADTGEGIPAQDLPHIFERFYRVDKSRARGRGSNGLGLAICKAILDAHSGDIEVRSESGAGSVFTVKLPGN